MHSLSKTRWKRLAILCTCFAVGLLIAGRLVLENYHTVLPGRVYRSAQLSPEGLEMHVARYGIKTVINLRGDNPDEEWYRQEQTHAHHLGIEHIDLPIDSFMPSPNEVRILTAILRECRQPILLHCESGIDRTGFASAVAYLLLDDASKPELAAGQLTWMYGCMPGRKSRGTKVAFLEAYEDWLRKNGLSHSREHFLTWIQQVTKSQSGRWVRSNFATEPWPVASLPAK